MPLESWKPQISQKAISVVYSFSDFHSDPRPIQADKAFIHFQKSVLDQYLQKYPSLGRQSARNLVSLTEIKVKTFRYTCYNAIFF